MPTVNQLVKKPRKQMKKKTKSPALTSIESFAFKVRLFPACSFALSANDDFVYSPLVEVFR